MRFAGSSSGIVSTSHPLAASNRHGGRINRIADYIPFLVWYFFSDVYPSLHGGQRPLDPPQFWRNLFERPPTDTGAAPIDNEIAAAAAPEVR